MYVDDGQLALTTVTWEPNVPDCVAPLLPVDQCLCPSIANRMTQCSSYVHRCTFTLVVDWHFRNAIHLSFKPGHCHTVFQVLVETNQFII
ncbi:unnamed protein product [Soboliphyme baturini]|uniref:Uncharacterized protein n=1 Tax=Soboliphyme baturini TaxID=241478 RepID=A0A183J542_9BILA|nr:unnamed protein product [Soboliphyme baturini]